MPYRVSSAFRHGRRVVPTFGRSSLEKPSSWPFVCFADRFSPLRPDLPEEDETGWSLWRPFPFALCRYGTRKLTPMPQIAAPSLPKL